MTVKYLIRLDDACPTQNRYNWKMIEDILDKYEVKPIVAVIPDCKDPSLAYDKPMENFWNIVKDWEKKGWTIGMHGYQHLYVPMDKRKSIVPIHNKTEFAGLPYEVQEEKIKRSWEIFINNGIKPNIWIAPSHTFDHNTLKALLNHTEIRIVSDGFAFDVFKYNNFFFIPQQLWKFIKPPLEYPFRLFTICLHPNTMSKEQILAVEKWLKNYRELFIDFNQLEFKNRNWSILEKFINNYIWFNKGTSKVLKLIMKKFSKQR
jgi:predicted deacetylase